MVAFQAKHLLRAAERRRVPDLPPHFCSSCPVTSRRHRIICRGLAAVLWSKHYGTTSNPNGAARWNLLGPGSRGRATGCSAPAGWDALWGFDGADADSCRRLAAPFDGVSGLAREPRRRVGGDAVIIVAGLSEQTGVPEIDTATDWEFANTCGALTLNMFPQSGKLVARPMTGMASDIIWKHDYAPLKTSEWVHRSNRQGDDTDTQAAGNSLNWEPGKGIKGCHYDLNGRGGKKKCPHKTLVARKYVLAWHARAHTGTNTLLNVQWVQ